MIKMAERNPNEERFRKKLRKETNRIWMKTIPIVVILYIAMMLSFLLAGSGVIESGVRTATYFILVIIGMMVGHKMTLHRKLYPIPDTKEKLLKKRVKEIWVKSIPLVIVTYIVMIGILIFAGDTMIIASIKTAIFFILIMAGIVIGHKVTLHQKLTMYVPEE